MSSETTLPTVWTVVLHFGDPEVTIRCLRSLAGIDYPCHRILVVDNDPGRTGEKAVATLPGTVYVPASRNLGFAAGMNLGIREAVGRGAEFVLLLNNDTVVVRPDFLRGLVAALEAAPDLGIVGPLVWIGREGIVQPTGMYDPTLRRLLFGRMLLRGVAVDPRPSLPRPVIFEAVTGVALLVRREVFARIGLLDEGYFLYMEETDFCRRARDAGFHSAVVPLPSIVHHHRPVPRGLLDHREIWLRRNTVRFIRLHSGWPAAVLAAGFTTAAGTAHWLFGLVRGRGGSPAAWLRLLRNLLVPLSPGLAPEIPRLP